MKLAFAGTPDFAKAALAALRDAGHDIALVLTQPDRPAGRGLQLQASAVKAHALEHGIAVAQPRGLRLDGKYAADAADARERLAATGAEAMVVAAYGLILPPWALALPRLGCLNVHASLLPRWRGAAPVQRAIQAGDAATGITIMQMDAGLDTGDVLATQVEPIRVDDTAGRLTARLATLGGRAIVDVLGRIAGGDSPPPVPQPSDGATYAAKIDKAEAAIDWSAPAEAIERRLRAFDPFPGASTSLAGETVKCWAGAVADGSGAPGDILAVGADGVVVACGSGALRLTELQRPGAKRLPAARFLQGKPVAVGGRAGGDERSPR